MPQQEPQMSVQTCERLLDHTLSHCEAQTVPAPSTSEASPGLADSFAALSAAIGWAALVLAIVALFGAFAWAWFVRKWAKEEAEKAAKEKLDELMPAFCQSWMRENVPQIVRGMQAMASVQTSAETEGEQETFNPDQVAQNVQDVPR